MSTPTIRSLLLPPGIPTAVITLLLLLFTAELFAQPERRIVPRHDFAVELPELGRMVGREGKDCLFGENIYPVGDVSGDSIADFIVTRRLCDTLIAGKTPDELTLYYGVSRGVPDVSDGIRVGPVELGATMKFIGAGDFDGDGRQDLVTSFHVFGDTSFGPLSGIAPKHLVIWWGQTGGGVSLEDTTHLSNGSPGWLLPVEGMVQDLDKNGVDDLVLIDPEGYQNQTVVFLPDILVYFGSSHERWGRELGTQPEWQWWSPPRRSRLTIFSRTQWIDQDQDGYLDFVFYNDSRLPLEVGNLSIIYGTPDHILDTANIVTISFDSANGKYAHFQDVTGDKVPELVMTTGQDESLKFFVGFKGQRVTEQYGLGNEPGRPGEDVWWGKPWAEVPLPGQLHDGWAPSGWSRIYDFGDGGLDDVNDIWVFSIPDFICYNGGERMDSIYDGWIRERGSALTSIATLGDIDGSGLNAIALGFAFVGSAQPYGIAFFQPTAALPSTGKFRYLPPGTEKPKTSADMEEPVQRGDMLGLQVQPNPSSGIVQVRWTPQQGLARLTITDQIGQQVTTIEVDASGGAFEWDASQPFAGAYYVTLETDGVLETERISVQQ